MRNKNRENYQGLSALALFVSLTMIVYCGMMLVFNVMEAKSLENMSAERYEEIYNDPQDLIEMEMAHIPHETYSKEVRIIKCQYAARNNGAFFVFGVTGAFLSFSFLQKYSKDNEK